MEEKVGFGTVIQSDRKGRQGSTRQDIGRTGQGWSGYRESRDDKGRDWLGRAGKAGEERN